MYVGSRQKMMDMDTKWATSTTKCIGTALNFLFAFSVAWSKCYDMVKNDGVTSVVNKIIKLVC